MNTKLFELDEILPIFDYASGEYIVDTELETGNKFEMDFLEDGGNLLNVSKEQLTMCIKRYKKIVNDLKKKNNYCCQICGYSFQMDNGKKYCEAHHLIPLSEGGSQEKDNVIILCANHHRMFHYASSKIIIIPMEDGSKKIQLDNTSYMVDNSK